MEEQLDGMGLNYEVVEAVTALKASSIGTDEYWNSWQRPLMITERACLLSHMGVWERVASAADSVPALVLEDDALLSRRLPEVVRAVGALSKVDHLTLEVRCRKKTISHRHLQLPGLDGFAVMRVYQDRSGAAGYVLWPSGAKKLLTAASRSAALADAMICGCSGLLSYQIEPACAVQLDVCEFYGVPRPMETHSTVSPTGRPSQRNRSAAHSFRRIRAQLGLGIHALRQFRRSVRREIALDPKDFL